MIEVALELQQLAATEDLVERHLLGHVAEAFAHAAGIHQAIHPSHPHAAGTGGEQGGEDPEGGGFTGAVGP